MLSDTSKTDNMYRRLPKCDQDMQPSPHRPSTAHFFEGGLRPGKMAKQRKILRTTAYRVVKQYLKRAHVESGRSRSFNITRIRSPIRKRFKRSNSISASRVASDLQISRKTAQRIVKQTSQLSHPKTTDTIRQSKAQPAVECKQSVG